MPETVNKALAFLFKHRKELARLKEAGVDDMLLDFGVGIGKEVHQPEYFPPELIVALSRFEMGLMFSAMQLPSG